MIKLLLLEDYILIAYHVLEYPRRTPLPLRIPPPTLQQTNLVPSSLSQQFEPRIQLDQYVRLDMPTPQMRSYGKSIPKNDNAFNNNQSEVINSRYAKPSNNYSSKATSLLSHFATHRNPKAEPHDA